MAKTKKKLSKEEKFAKGRERKKLKYEAIKSNPELYRVHQEKEKQRYLLKKEKKKVVSINEMSNREKREQRRKWRKNSLNYQKKLKEQKKVQQLLIENSPPESECEEMQEPRIIDEDDPLAVANPPQPPPEKKNETTKQDRVNKNENTAILKKTIRRIRYKHVKVLGEMKKKIQDLEKENEKLRINQNQEQTQKANEDTIEKKVNKIIKDIKEDKLQEVKRKLLFSETIAKGFCEKYKTSAKKDKRGLAAFLTDNEKLSRYRILSKMPFSLK